MRDDLSLLKLITTPGLLGGGGGFGALLRALVDAIPGSVYWDHQEPSGAVLGAYNSVLALGRDVVIDGDFAQVGDWTEGANWTIGGGNATHAAGSVELLSQDGIAAVGKTWQLTYTISNRTAGSVTAKLGASYAARNTNDTFVETITATSADLDFTPTSDFDGNIDDVILQQTNILASSAYGDPANNPLSGTHTGVTVGQPATAALGLAVLDDGATSFTNIYSAEINSMFDPGAFSLLIFAQAANAGVWTDTTIRRLVSLRSDASNRFLTGRTATNNDLQIFYNAGGTAKSVNITTSTLDWFMIAVTVNKGANEMKVYFNGVQTGSTQSGLGIWVGNLDIAQSVIGATSTIPTNTWDGFRTRVALYREALDADTILQWAKATGVA